MNRANQIGQRIVKSINKKLMDNGLQDKCRMWNYTGGRLRKDRSIRIFR